MIFKKMPWMRRVGLAWISAVKGAKKLVRQAKEKVELDRHFSHLALKWDRISAGMVKFDPTFWGIFDRDALTVTFRAEDSLELGQLIETEHVQYRVGELRSELVQLPLTFDQALHQVPCRVAVLVKI